MEASTEERVPSASPIATVLAEHAARSRGIGEGEFPAELTRFSWGVFFFPWLWSMRRGVWWVLLVWLTSVILGPLSFRLLDGNSTSPLWVVFDLVTTFAYTVFFLWLGVNGNRLAWKAAARTRGDAKMTVGRLIDGEATWIAFGVLLYGALLVLFVLAVLDEAVGPGETLSFAIDFLSVGMAIYLNRNVGSALWNRFATAEHPTSALT